MKRKLKATAAPKQKTYEEAAKGQYTVKKKCIDCGAIRMCKPQDAWQVKRCIDCQGKKKGAKLKALIERVKSPEHAKAKALKRLDDKHKEYVERDEAVIASMSRHKKRLSDEFDGIKRKRIWPK